MPRLPALPETLRKLFRHSPGKPVTLVAERFLQLFRDHGIEVTRIPRLLPELKLDDLQSPQRLLAILTPARLDRAAKLFGIRVEWLEGCDDRIYDTLYTYKEPQRLLDHLRRIGQQPGYADEAGFPLRILATTTRLDYRDDDHQELAPILVEPIATLGDETIYRYHIYQDGFCWDHPPARIELKAIARIAFRALRQPIPIYPITPQDMAAVLDGRRIPRDLLDHCLITNPSLEDYVLDPAESAVAKETGELPAVLDYMARMDLNAYDFKAVAASETTGPDEPETPLPPPQEASPPPAMPAEPGKQQTARERWQKIEAAAIALWAQDRTLRIAEVARRIRALPEIKAAALQPDTIHRHIARHAPPDIKGKPGRQPRQSG